MQDLSPMVVMQNKITRRRGRMALIKLGVLLFLCLWMYKPEVADFVRVAMHSHDWVHALATPLAILALFYLRRREWAEGVTDGSTWGLAGVIFGLVLYATATWPFDYKYIRDLSILPVLGGIVLAAVGPRAFRLSLPILLLILLSIPIGSRIHSNLVIRPETYTLRATQATLDRIPRLHMTLQGSDLHYTHHGQSGVVALGESRRGVAFVPAYLTIAVFVAFARIRPFWQIAILALIAGPLALFCNYVRLLNHALVTIYADLDPASAVPRYVAMISSLLLAYVAVALLCGILSGMTGLMSSDMPVVDQSDTEEVP